MRRAVINSVIFFIAIMAQRSLVLAQGVLAITVQTTVSNGNQITFTGQVTQSGGPVANATVVYEIRSANNSLTASGFTVTNATGVYSRSLTVSLGYQSFLGLALPGNVSGAAPMSQFLLGILIFGVLILVNILKPKAGYRIVAVFTVVGILTMILAMGILLAAGNQGVQNYIASLNSMGSNVTYTGLVNSYSGSSFNLLPNLFILPFFAIFVYPWVVAGPAVASEIKGKDALRWNVPLAAIISVLLLTAGFAVMYSVGGFAFTNAALANANLVYNYSFNFWTLAMGVTTVPAVAWAIGLGWIIWNMAVLAYGIIIFSRYVFAQAFDRFLPAKLAYVSPTFASPVIAHAIDLVLTIAFVGLAAFLYGPLSSLFGVVLSAVIYFAFVGLATVVYAFRNEKGTSKTILVISGMALVYAFLSYEFLSSPNVWGGNNLAYGYIVVSFLGGLAVYGLSRMYYKKQGIDIGLAFKEIPPE